MISFHAKSLSKIMGAVLRAGTDMEKFFQPIYVLEFIKWNRRDGPISNGGIRERGDARSYCVYLFLPSKMAPTILLTLSA